MSATTDRITRRALNFQHFAIAYNILAGIIAITAGQIASSISLISFGLHSLIEASTSLLDLLHQRATQRVIALSLYALAAWTAYASLEKAMSGESSQRSLAGLLIAIASVLGQAKQTNFRFYLSLILLLGMSAPWLLGWNQVDAVAALLMSPILVTQARRTWRGESCCGDTSCH